MPQPKIFSIIDKAVYDYGMIKDGARILVGASGGKDSTAMLEYLANRMHRTSSNFSVTALYIKTDFGPDFNPELRKMIEGWGIKFETLFVNTLERVKPGFKMSCYWCSNQRRKELIHYALDNGFDYLALGHHRDDVLETLLMNMINAGKLQTMPPVLQYEKYPLKIIRPLYYVPVSEIISHAKESGWKQMTCTCTYQDNSGRKKARSRLEALTEGDEAAKKRILMSLKHIDFNYLP